MILTASGRGSLLMRLQEPFGKNPTARRCGHERLLKSSYAHRSVDIHVSPMIDGVFENLMLRRLADWEVVRLGLTNIPGQSLFLSASCVASFAMARLETLDLGSPFLTHIVAMATEPQLSTLEILAMVERICERTGTDQALGLRCWRWGLLNEMLQGPEEAPMYGVIRLDEFVLAWSSMELVPPLPCFPDAPTSQYMSPFGYLRRLDELRDWSKIEGDALREARGCMWSSDIA